MIGAAESSHATTAPAHPFIRFVSVDTIQVYQKVAFSSIQSTRTSPATTLLRPRQVCGAVTVSRVPESLR